MERVLLRVELMHRSKNEFSKKLGLQRGKNLVLKFRDCERILT